MTTTGRRTDSEGLAWVVLDRTFDAPPDVVWAWVTEPARLKRWIGTWEGDPGAGHVAFRMTAEGDDVPVETMRVEACVAPERLRVASDVPGGAGEWVMDLTLVATGAGTTLTFAQSLPDPELAGSVGPGWEYYLDRLATAAVGGDVAAVVWDDYHPALAAPYSAMFGAD